MAKAVTPTDSSQQNLAAADHANEEIIRKIHWREFGAGRTDDFSSLINVTSDRVFTLDDGTTTLVGDDIFSNINVSGETGISFQAANDSLTLTFVGTGLDVIATTQSGAGNEVTNWEVDGVSIGTTTLNTDDVPTRRKIVSGLPYGTHTVKIIRDASTALNVLIRDFIIYGPKVPALPVGAKAIADYFVMADYAINNTPGTETVSSGVLTKTSKREFIYTGALWSYSAPDPTRQLGGQVQTAGNGDAASYTFWGTGFEMRFTSVSGGSADVNVNLDGSSDFSLLTNSVITADGGVNWTPATGTLDTDGAGGVLPGRLVVSGLTLGFHTVTLTNQTAQTFRLSGMDIITPIHSPKLNGPFVKQNVLDIGSQGIRDLRKFSKKDVFKEPAASEASAITSAPSTTNVLFIPHPDMAVPVYVEKNTRLRINFDSALFALAGSPNIRLLATVDGKNVGHEIWHDVDASTGQPQTSTGYITIKVSKGFHFVQIFWSTNSGTAATTGLDRSLTVEEVN